jgi:hypothetical protein
MFGYLRSFWGFWRSGGFWGFWRDIGKTVKVVTSMSQH